MPRGIKNTPPTPPMKAAAPQPTAPAPMIILQPQADGTLINAYGLEMAECIDELRRALLHLVARQSGVTIISEVVSRQAAVVLAQRATPAPTSVTPNGSKPKTKPYMKGPRGQYDVRDAPELRHLPDDSAGRVWTEMEDIDFQRGV